MSSPHFDHSLHQAIPQPLAAAYRKAFNSPSAKDLHDNALHFAFCLTRILAAIAVAQLRELGIRLAAEDAALLASTDTPSDGQWNQWLLRSLAHLGTRQLPPDMAGPMLDQFAYAKLRQEQSSVPPAVAQMQSFLDDRPVNRATATPLDFFSTLVTYRNKTLGHGAVMPEAQNQTNGEAILAAAAEMAGNVPLWEGWDLKAVADVSLEGEALACRFINLTGPDWLREPAARQTPGRAAPIKNHVVLLSKEGKYAHLDLHPMLVFREGRVWFFNGCRRKDVVYLDYETNRSLRLADCVADYESWKASLASDAADTGPPVALGDGEAGPAAPAGLELSRGERFRFDRLLGRGGMGEVWLAYDETLKRPVAIKRIRRELLGEADVYRRFLQEARDAAKLAHPNIVPILSIESDDDGPYLVLELMEGGSLRERLRSGKLPLQEALAYLRQILGALQTAHEHNIVHRDIKPENILLSKAGVPKLGDFGLAWALDEQDPQVAAASEGTRPYLAPELAAGNELPCARTDLYSLGTTFYEMLTGQAGPVRDKSVPSPALPLVRKLTFSNPNLRYDSAQAALADCVELERALELAGRSDADTQARIEQTLRQGYELLAACKAVDAQACFERVLAERPQHGGAATGLLMVGLVGGDMATAASRYAALRDAGAQDPMLARLQHLFDSFPQPVQLFITPQAMPFSYLLDELRGGRFIKELVECDPRTINLGDVGELLVELVQRDAAAPQMTFTMTSPDSHVWRLRLARVDIEATFRPRAQRGGWFSAPRLLGTGLWLVVRGDSFEVIRLARYLAGNLVRRFKRDESQWIDRATAAAFGVNVPEALQRWRQVNLRFDKFVATAIQAP